MSPTVTRTLHKPMAPPARSGLTLPFNDSPMPQSGAAIFHWLPRSNEYLVAAPKLRLPVRIEISKEDGPGYVALSKASGVVGSGRSVALAIRDLLEAMQEHLEVLRLEDSLSNDLEDHLRYLTEHLLSQ